MTLLKVVVFILCFLLQSCDAKFQCFKDFNLEERFNQNRILRGDDCDLGQWPFVVQIKIGDEICTGSIIGDQYILTASHCLFDETDYTKTPRNPADYKIIVGSVKYAETGEIYDVEKLRPHVDYDNQGEHDIALLKLKTPIKFSDTVKPICLPSKFQGAEKAVAIGFGVTAKNTSRVVNPKFGIPDSTIGFEMTTEGGICKFTDIPLRPESQCKNLPKHHKLQYFPQNEICGGGVWKGTLKGDSGGPLIGLFEDGYYQIGVTARGQPVGIEDFGVYTKVSKYCQWISEQTKGEIKCV